jgi:hypothetical protein
VASAVLVTLALALASNGCDDLKIAHSQGGPDDPSSPLYDGGPDATNTPADGGGTMADATSAPAQRPYYVDVQAALETRRFAGPTTGTSARGHCTPSYFVWVDLDKSVHSWRGTTKARIDYGFTDNGFHSYLLPSDVFYTVERPFVFLDVYRMNAANMLASSIPYSDNFVSANDGVILLDQKIDGVDVGGTKVRRWNATSMVTEDITGVLPTREPPSSFDNDTLVVPGGKSVPYPFHIVDVVKKTSSTVTYSNGSMVMQTLPSADGLLVAYVNGGSGGAALRLYKGNADTAAARLEIGDDIDALPAYFEDPPTTGQEHDFRPTIATWGKKVLFSTDFGIWSYDLASKVLAPVQLNAGKVPAAPTMMCVIRDAGLLVYKSRNDLSNQVWAVPLSAMFP